MSSCQVKNYLGLINLTRQTGQVIFLAQFTAEYRRLPNAKFIFSFFTKLEHSEIALYFALQVCSPLVQVRPNQVPFLKFLSIYMFPTKTKNACHPICVNR